MTQDKWEILLAGYDLAEAIRWREERIKIITAFSTVYESVMKRGIEDRIKVFESFMQKYYMKNYEDSKKGVPYVKRMEYAKKIEFARKSIEELKNKKIPKLADLLQWGDYSKIKSMGFTKFINLYHI